MNKVLGGVHTLVAFLVLLYFCLDPILGTDGSQWEWMSWVMLVTALLATYFSFGFDGDSDGGGSSRFWTLLMTLLVVHQTLGGSAGSGDLWAITTVLYVVCGIAIGRKLRS